MLVAAFIGMAGLLSGQQNTLSLGLGGSRIDRQDLIFSPFVQSGTSASHFDLRWERKGSRFVQFAGIRYSGFSASRFNAFQYTTKPDAAVKTTLPHAFTFVKLEYGLGKTWQSGRFTFSGGGVLENNVQALNYQYGESSFFGYFMAFSLSPRLDITWPAGKNGRLNAEISFPLLSWVARSPYLVNDDEFIKNASSHSGLRTFAELASDGKLQFPDQLQQLNAGLGYSRQLGARWTAGLHYGFQFVRHTDPLTLLSYQHDLRIQIGRRF